MESRTEMTDEILQYDEEEDDEPSFVWTFKISGGSEFHLKLKNQPPLSHTGSLTLWKLVGTKKYADMVLTYLVGVVGCEATRYVEMQSQEQEALRLQLLKGHEL